MKTKQVTSYGSGSATRRVETLNALLKACPPKMSVLEYLRDNPDWLKGLTKTRIRMKLQSGETPLLCPDSFVDPKELVAPAFWDELSKAEFIALERF